MAGIADEVSSPTTSSPLRSFTSMSPTALGSPCAPWLRELNSDERGLFLIHLLLNCANHVAAGDLYQANALLEPISFLSSGDGDTVQRIASYFSTALARRLLRSWPGVYRALDPSLAGAGADGAGGAYARRLFLDLCPFLRLSFLISNQAIMESMEGEKVIHLVDLGGSDPTHWLSLLQALAGRPEGPPHLRITAVSEQSDLLAQTASLLSNEAERLDIPFQFNAIVSPLDVLDVESLRVKTGEALAVVSALHLHTLLACGVPLDKDSRTESPSPAKMERLLSSIWGLSPKIFLVTEQESNHNGLTLNERFMEALNFYSTLFDCLESTAPRHSPDRARVEKMFGEEIKNIISCEGPERKERHERLERWTRRLEMAGFRRRPMTYYGMLQARRMLLAFGCDGCRVKEENGCLLLCWQDRALYSVSAWRCRRYD
ncbi:Scarecrow-like protein 3 [Apostasia shenzhenica]|uniref:Scarecrow-like protein 3 n=1 Tax=Apostasia shenzhenica TaxID=1088818 RepID=A0A2I0AST8_9ASPA|nr:Scarecrow-like protein 3 [Apostasia shenzhenica]